MLVGLSIENFKSIKSLDFPVNGLNILIGPNSSGKTSVLQSLALLKQSLIELNFGGLVNVGNFKDAVYNHNDHSAIVFNLRINAPSTVWISGFSSQFFECLIEIKGNEQKQPFVSRSLIADVNHGKAVIDFVYRRRDKDSERGIPAPEIISEFPNVNFEIKGIIPRALSGPMKQIEEYKEIYDVIAKDLENSLFYLSARRGNCSRSENVDARYSSKPSDVGMFGENLIPVLAHIQNDEEYVESMQKIRFWLNEFGLSESVATLVQGRSPNYSLKVKNEKTGIQSTLVDVGFGVNQLLAVIVQCFYAQKGSLIMIEQPEAHLHPRYQADVADFLIDVVNYGNRVIVETHSEHLLLRLQRRIAEKKISPDNINVTYFDFDSKGTKPLQMKLDENGYFVKPIPEGFFEEGFEEAFAHVKALSAQGGKIEPKK